MRSVGRPAGGAIAIDVRIIAGEHRGARIFAPKGLDTRPTSDRVREAAFNLIGPVDGAAVLDLFAGSGAMGLEALSRGAASAVFVESDRDACRTIDREHREAAGLTGARVVQQDVLQALATDARRRTTSSSATRPTAIRSYDRLAPYLAPRARAGRARSSTRPERAKSPKSQGLRVRTSRTYGSARLTLFEH